MKKEVKKSPKKNKKYTKQDKALIITFAMLVVLVIVLAVIALNMKNIINEEKANIVIPILETNSVSEISVDISDMKEKETKEYIFEVVNYKDKEVLAEKLSYNINIIASENTILKLYKNDSEKDIIKDASVLIKDNKLPKNKKTHDKYRLIIEATKQPTKKDVVTLKINS